MIDALTFEETQIKLELEEIKLRKRLNEIKHEKTKNSTFGKKEAQKSVSEIFNTINSEDTPTNKCILHYTKSAKSRIPVIKEICPDGTIYIRGKCDSKIITHTYSMNSLSWLKQKLPKFALRQKNERNFWHNVAGEYSKQFTRISHTKVAELCYFVDSGLCDEWFKQWKIIKARTGQSTLD